MDDIHDLFRKVQQHPDFVFGTIFTVDDFAVRAAPEDFRYNRADESLMEAGWAYIENMHGDVRASPEQISERLEAS